MGKIAKAKKEYHEARQLGFAGLEGEKAFAMNEKCYIAAYVSGGVLAEPVR